MCVYIIQVIIEIFVKKTITRTVQYQTKPYRTKIRNQLIFFKAVPDHDHDRLFDKNSNKFYIKINDFLIKFSNFSLK
jgi:hypothetical protein